MKVERKLEKEIVKDEKGIAKYIKNHTVRIVTLSVLFVLIVGVIIFLSISQSRVYIEKSEIGAPVIVLSPQSPGVLENVFVKEGDIIPSGTTVAQVNGNSIKSEVNGLVISVQNTPGQVVNAQTPVVRMINPEELRVIGHIEENKGLDLIKKGQRVVFTADAFGSKQYEGIVDSVSPTSRTSDIVFSISDKRQENEFDVKVKFDVNSYPELKNGMSAKMWVYK